jgi:CHASE2 domain-containing sensor protein
MLDVLAWAGIGLGTIAAGYIVYRLTKIKAPKRRSIGWAYLRLALLVVGASLIRIGESWPEPARWLVTTGLFVLMVIGIRSLIKERRRSTA